MFKFNKITLTLIIVLFTSTLILFGLWKSLKNTLEQTRAQLTNANNTICSLQLENEKLVAYNQIRDEKLEQIQKAYKKALANIPKDSCGDTKPSKELLNYFRKGYNQ